jgi:hypothetical protein
VIADASGTTGGAWVTIRDSQVQGNYIDGLLATGAGAAIARITINSSTIADNGFTSGLGSAAGVKADGASAQVRIQNNMITVNKNGVLIANGGIIYSYGGNIISGNSINGTFTSTQPAQ